MKYKINHLEVLILTAIPKDAELTLNVLEKAKLQGLVVDNVQKICEMIDHAGALIISEEVLSVNSLKILQDTLKCQPMWSDIPIILVASGGGSTFDINKKLDLISKYLQNFTLLEKPIRLATLITVVRTALFSRKKQFEQRKILDELARSKKEAEDANKSKSSFLANVSHEIRTPLSVIIGFLELLKIEGAEKKDFKKYVDIIARNGEQLANLINDVLDLAKIESGKVEIRNHPIELADFFLDLQSLLRPIVEKENLIFNFEAANNFPETIFSDEGKIRQILINLVGNATKFTKAGSITLNIKVEKIENDKLKVIFAVIDTGIGIEEKKQSKIFNPFSQADESVTREFGGTGLGLALSKKLAESLGGDIRLIKSEPGKGSYFEVYIIAQKAYKQFKETEINNNHIDELSGMSILLVEDFEDNQYLLSEYLLGANAKVDIASNGLEAINLAKLNKYDVIIMDIQMPVMDGLTATKKLRKEKYEGAIIALSAHALKADKEKSLLAGFNAHLTKPILGRNLIEAVKSFR